jgi:hypothetical protein
MSNEPMSSIESGMSSPMSSAEVNQLAARVSALETRLSPNSWLYSSNFFKRALALWGHVIAIQLVLAVIIWAVFFGCALLFGGFAAFLGNR